MKIQVDGQELFELSDVQQKVIKNEIHENEFESDMKRRLEYILKHKYERCFERLKQTWDPILATRHESVPTDPEAYAQLVFSQPDYKSASERKDAEQN
jgi:hypothetical protein